MNKRLSPAWKKTLFIMYPFLGTIICGLLLMWVVHCVRQLMSLPLADTYKVKSYKMVLQRDISNNTYQETSYRRSGRSPWAQKVVDSYDRRRVEPLDFVFMWVNGTDPRHIRQYEDFTGKHMDAEALARLRDYGTLRFGLRSAEKFVPWHRKLFLVTNGQVPSWWNPKNSRGQIVTHNEIFFERERFPNGTRGDRMVPIEGALPTFNSNAIEANIRNIPGLSKYILFMNDDFIVSGPLKMDKFINPTTGSMKFNMIGVTAPFYKAMQKNQWDRSIAHTNNLINSKYHPTSKDFRHQYARHVCYLYDRDVLNGMYEMWPEAFENTSRNHLRTEQDVVFPFMVPNVAMEERLGKAQSDVRGGYITWTTDHAHNIMAWNRMLEKSPDCLCIQDGFFLHDDNGNVDEEAAFLEKKLCELLPEKSSFERPDDINPCDKYKKNQNVILPKLNEDWFDDDEFPNRM